MLAVNSVASVLLAGEQVVGGFFHIKVNPHQSHRCRREITSVQPSSLHGEGSVDSICDNYQIHIDEKLNHFSSRYSYGKTLYIIRKTNYIFCNSRNLAMEQKETDI